MSILYDKNDCIFKNENRCLYSKNSTCWFCSDYMKEIRELSIFQHIQINEIKKNRGIRVLFSILSFCIALISIYISLTK